MRKMLFHRDFQGYTGGHGKVWDYFNHAIALGWDARVYLTPGSRRDASNPWLAAPDRIEQRWDPGSADLLFLGGTDWNAVPEHGIRVPAVNLVQHVRHADDDDGNPLRGFLRRPATRICVSRAVAEAIGRTGLVDGPVHVVPAGIPALSAPEPGLRRDEVLIGALKQPALGAQLHAALAEHGIRAELASSWMPRDAFLGRVAKASLLVALPHSTEGFYLPGLEAMALGCPLVMPDCVGNREYATHLHNCLMPSPSVPALVEAVLEMRVPGRSDALVESGLQTARRYTLQAEREAFGGILARAFPE